MPVEQLTDTYVRNLKAPSEGRFEVSDATRRGLRIRVTPQGKKTWVFEKRIRGGAKRKTTLGTYPAMSLKQARDLALELEREAANGMDRKSAEEAERQESAARAVTVEAALDLYDDLHAARLRTQSERMRTLRRILVPHLQRPIRELTRRDLQDIIDAKAREGRIVYANRFKAYLAHFAKFAWHRELTQDDLGPGLQKAGSEKPRDRAPTIEEIRKIWRASLEEDPLWGGFLRLLILTAQRRSEILKLRWSEVDFEHRQLRLSGERTKNGKPHITHLAQPALDELAGLKTLTGDKALVFTTTGSTPMSGTDRFKRRLDRRLGASMAPWRLHDLRTGFATAMADAGEPENVVDRILNHVASGSAPSAVARVYNRAELLPQRAEVLEQWAELVTRQQARDGR